MYYFSTISCSLLTKVNTKYEHKKHLLPILPKAKLIMMYLQIFQPIQVWKSSQNQLSWTWKLNFLPIKVNNLFKFQAQGSDLEYLFWQCEKHITLSEKSHL